jgi:HK97 family phage prohead protease
MEHIGHFRALYERTLPDGAKEFVASTSGVKRDGLTLDMRGGLLDNYLRNPVVLWAHDYQGTHLPVGKTSKLKVLAKELRATIQFDLADPFAAEIARKYDEGYLNAVSIGWIDREVSADRATVTKWELLDISAVPVPGDPDALLRREYAMLRSIVAPEEVVDIIEEAVVEADPVDEPAEAEQEPPEVRARGAVPPHTSDKADENVAWDGPKTVAGCPPVEAMLRRMHAWVDPDGDPDAKQSYKLPHHLIGGEVVWKGVAAAMARLLQGGTQIPDADRKGVWNHLDRHYRQFDKETPELRSLAEFGPRLQAGAMPQGEWEHYRAELAQEVLAHLAELKQAIANLEAATEEPPPPDPALVDALSQVAEALKERT